MSPFLAAASAAWTKPTERVRTIIVRKRPATARGIATVCLVHAADAAAKKGDIKGVERAHFIALLMQGLRIAIPAALLLMVPTQSVQAALNAMPDWLKDGMSIGGGMVVAVGYAMVRCV